MALRFPPTILHPFFPSPPLFKNKQAKLVRRQAQRERAQRRRELARYVPDVARALMGVLNAMLAQEEEAGAPGPASGGAAAERAAKRQRLADAADAALAAAGVSTEGGGEGSAGGDLLAKVAAGEVSEATLRARLEQHIEAVEAEEAIEYAAAAGVAEGARRDLYLQPELGEVGHGLRSTRLRSAVATLRLFSAL